MADETVTQPVADRNEKGQFIQGVSGNPRGKPQGARTKLGEQFIEALQADFQAHGTAAIEKVRSERPQDYIKVIASLLPKEMVIRDELDEMSDEQLLERLHRLNRLIGPFLGDPGSPEDRQEARTTATH